MLWGRPLGKTVGGSARHSPCRCRRADIRQVAAHGFNEGISGSVTCEADELSCHHRLSVNRLTAGSCKAIVGAQFLPFLRLVSTMELPVGICRGAAIDNIRRGLQRHYSVIHILDVRERHHRTVWHEQIRRVGRQRGHVIRAFFARLYHRADPLVQVFVVHHFLEAVELAALVAFASIAERQYHRRCLSVSAYNQTRRTGSLYAVCYYVLL